MMALRRSAERGLADHGWLKSFHTFSFADYYDPKHMGFGPLRVINEDRVQPGRGFGTHGHRDMEIISYVLDGELAHQDSMGNGSHVKPGDVQRMSAGTGVTHSEFNASDRGRCISCRSGSSPTSAASKPGYEEKRFEDAEKRGKLAPGRLARRPRRLGHHPPGRERLCGAGRRRRGGGIHPAPGQEDVPAPGARDRARER